MMLLKNTYSRDDFLKFLEDSFLADFKKDIRPASTQGFSSIQKAYSLGRSESLDLQVFEFSFEGSPNKRVTLTKDAFQVMRSSAIFRALAIFHSPDSDDWRLSLMTATPERTEKGKASLSYSNPKRLSFFLGPNAKVNTPTRFILKKDKIVDFEDLKSRFSIEVVNKEFYKEISEYFTQLVGGSLYVGKKKQDYKALLKLPFVQDKSQTSLEFAVRLIGRIIFCWFLREKKSDQGKSLMPNDLLSLEAVKNNTDYYHKILEPIFFEVLNRPIKSRKDDYSGEPFSSIPYLNGGLFSPHDDDYYKRTNGDFQSQFHNTLVIPDEWLIKFFEVLETYNFTIDENTSFDEELSIDPEMLGRIFENLLAEINPETGESARKSTGSYYTPRIIVDYMVDESLLLYLKTQTQIDEEKLRAVISYDLNDDEETPLRDDEKEQIINALEKVKILDPACGSGAFPMGALQKIVFILQQADPEGQLWFKKQIKNTAPEIKKVIEREFAHKNFDYIRKLGIIRENIYGVDIQPIATEISRLRCFLTLIVDQRIQEDIENRGIQHLPNLDFKFVTANSLVGLPKIDLSQQSMFDDYQKIDELKQTRDEFFNSSGIEREQLKTQFVLQQKRLVDQLIKEHGFMGVVKAELTQKLTDWEPFIHKTTSWFDPDWMFGIKDGFDLIIANPPYVLSRETFSEKEKSYFKANYKLTYEKPNLYLLFIERSNNILNEKGILSFIIPNSWLGIDSASKLRKQMLEKYSIKVIVNLLGETFDLAGVEPSILIYSRQMKIGKVRYTTTLDKDICNVKFLENDQREWLTNRNFLIDITSSPVEYELLKKIINDSILLKSKYDVRVGLQAYEKGKGDPKQTSEDVKGHIFDYSYKFDEFTFKYLGGSDVSRYKIKWSGTWLRYGKWLSQPKRFDQFSQPRILIREITGKYPKLLHCAYIEDTFLNNKSILNILPLSEDYNIKFLLAYLNSKLMSFYHKRKTVKGNRSLFPKIVIKDLKVYPIPKITLDEQMQFVNLVDRIMEIALSDNYSFYNPPNEQNEIEAKINNMVYKLYGLTQDEIKIVEGV